jgi:hypothetical protein
MAARSVLTLQPTSWRSSPPRGKALLLRARPMGAVALRLPEKVGAHLAHVFPVDAPRIFVHEGARQALERRLMAAFPGPVSLSITDNRHSMISHSWRRGMLRARIHHMFLDAPPSIVHALVRYVAHGERDASVRIGNYIEANGSRLARRSRRIPLVTSGKNHDLYGIFRDINEKYFDNDVTALITWGKRGPRRSTRRTTIKLGSYSQNERLIRIHPALDRTWVPRYFVAYVVFHEMLHHVVPARRGNETSGRRDLHPEEFREREHDFRHHERALRWEKQHIGRLLRT